jgi:DNA-binding NtrC family response regulator
MKEKTIKILLVEDDKVDQMAFERMVREAGFPCRYRIADSAEDVYPLLNAETFDVAIMDHVFAGEAELELFDVLSDIPIIIVSGSGDQELAYKARQAGALAYLLKDTAGTYLETLPLLIKMVVAQ